MAAGTISPIYDTDAENAKDWLNYANALRAKSLESGGKMVGKVYVAKNPWENFAEGLVGGGVNAYQRQQQRGMEQAQEQARQGWLGQMPQATEVAPQFGPAPDGSSLPDVVRDRDAGEFARDTTAWAVQAPRGMEAVQQGALAQAVNAPIRAVERKERIEAQQQLAREKQEAVLAATREKLEEQRERDKERFEQQKELRALTASLAASNRGGERDPRTQIAYGPDGKGYLVNMRTGEQMPLGEVGKAPKAPSANDIKAEKLAGAEGRIDKIIDEASKNEKSFGIVPATASMLPNVIGSRITSAALNEKQRIARANVMRQAAQEIHELYGAALSRGEAGRANSFAPNPNDDYESVMTKLKSAKAYAASIKPSRAAPAAPADAGSGEFKILGVRDK